jgi:hypothetical protein
LARTVGIGADVNGNQYTLSLAHRA